MRLWIGFLSLLLLAGCTHSVHLVNFSDFPKDASWQHAKLVKAKAQQFVIMGFVFDTKYANNAYSDLQKQCATGSIYGISSKYYTDHGFFSWTNNLEMQGYCM